MPVHEDNLDGFAFEGSEEDAIAATAARGRKHLRLVSEGTEDAEEHTPTEPAPAARAPAPEPAPAAPPPERAVRAAPMPPPPSYAPPRPVDRDQRGRPFLWAVGLASALILAIMAANPLIQSLRNPLPPPPVQLSASERHAAPTLTPSPEVVVGAPEPERPTPEAPPEPPAEVEAAAPPEAPAPAPARAPAPEAAPPAVPAAAPAPEPAPSSRRSSTSSRRSSSKRRSAPPAAAPAPTPEPAPEPPAPSSGRVSVQGDAASVRLVGNGGAFGAGDVPAGTYTIQASFGEGSPMVTTGEVVVPEGGQVTVRCNATFMACKAR